METKAYPAFGYIKVRNTVTAGGLMNSEVVTNNRYAIQNPSPFEDGNYGGLNSGYVWLYTEGKTRTRDLHTGETIVYSAGWSNLNSAQPAGEFKFVVEEPLTVFCLGAIDNHDKIPKIPRVEYFGLEAGQSKLLSVGTKLFLCHGDSVINGKNFSGPRQIKVISEETVIAAKTTCYGLIFP